MGECGCIAIQYFGKIIDRDGNAWIFGIYPSCHYCDAPLGLQFYKVLPTDFECYD
jgi:hypothetical protein